MPGIVRLQPCALCDTPIKVTSEPFFCCVDCLLSTSIVETDLMCLYCSKYLNKDRQLYDNHDGESHPINMKKITIEPRKVVE